MTAAGALHALTSASALEVAPALLGAVLSHTTPEGTVSVRLPISRPDFPRASSAMSGFFFCGMMLEPVE
jgi:hypothetical protein